MGSAKRPRRDPCHILSREQGWALDELEDGGHFPCKKGLGFKQWTFSVVPYQNQRTFVLVLEYHLVPSTQRPVDVL